MVRTKGASIYLWHLPLVVPRWARTWLSAQLWRAERGANLGMQDVSGALGKRLHLAQVWPLVAVGLLGLAVAAAA